MKRTKNGMAQKRNPGRYSLANPTQCTYHLMLLPGIILLLIFSYYPMYGIVMAFQNFIPAKGFTGSKWVGMKNFNYIFSLPNTWTLFANTLYYAVANIILDIIFPILFAVLLNEVRHNKIKRTIQTAIYLPHFLSWVLLAEIFRQMFALSGPINNALGVLGIDPVYFLGDSNAFRPFIVISNVWKGFGYSSIIYTASILNIDPGLYEAAFIDGATRLQRILYITIPGMMSVIVLKMTLSLGSVLSANFDQIFNLYSPLVYDVGDIIDTYVYRMGIQQAQYSISTAIGLLKSVISSMLIIVSYGLAKKFAGYRIF
jgi:putative aldouronate transport system permease protein